MEFTEPARHHSALSQVRAYMLSTCSSVKMSCSPELFRDEKQGPKAGKGPRFDDSPLTPLKNRIRDSSLFNSDPDVFKFRGKVKVSVRCSARAQESCLLSLPQVPGFMPFSG